MKRFIPLTLVLLMCASLMLTGCGSVTHTINVTAPDALDICGLYVSKSGADAYGENQLKDGATLAAKGETKLEVPAGGNYDLKMVGCDGQEAVLPVTVP